METYQSLEVFVLFLNVLHLCQNVVNDRPPLLGFSGCHYLLDILYLETDILLENMVNILDFGMMIGN